MIDHMNPWLDKWAEWSILVQERLGHSSTSPVHKMMTSNAATTSKLKHRSQHHLMVMGEGENVRYVSQDIQPMRCVESTGKRSPNSFYTDPACEMMEEAFSQLREPNFKDAIRLKYMSGFNNQASANMMRVVRK